jgi:hypothetical protein
MTNIVVNETASFVKLKINASGVFADANAAMADTANVVTVPALTDVTLNATPGTFTWEQLDELSQQIVTTPSTNSVSLNAVLDTVSFFDGGGSTAGIWDITNNKTKVYFRLFMNGDSAGDYYVEGKGYLSGLAPTVSPTAPVWVTPLEILVEGSYTQAVVT